MAQQGRLFVVACLSLAILGCGPNGPKGRVVKWRFGGKEYTTAPDRIVGQWTNGQWIIAFDRAGGAVWKGVQGRYRFQDDGALLVQVEGPGVGTDSFKYSVIDDKLILLSNQWGTFSEYRRADAAAGP